MIHGIAGVQRSYINGTGEHPLWHMTLPDLLDQRAREYPDKEAHVFWNFQHVQGEDALIRESITYRDLADRSYNVAMSLLDMGLEPGDRVAIIGDNCPEWLLLEYASLRCKLILVRISRRNATAKVIMNHIVKHQCKAIVVDGKINEKVTRLIVNMFLVNHDLNDSSSDEEIEDHSEEDYREKTQTRVIGLHHDHGGRIMTIKDLAEPASDYNKVKNIQDSIDPDDVAVALTTWDEEPKLITFSHFALINNARCVAGEIIKNADYVLYDASSFVGVDCPLYTSISLGITIINMQWSEENLDHMSTILAQEKITVGRFSPSFLKLAYKKSSNAKGENTVLPSSLQFIITETSSLDEEVVVYYQRQYRGIMQYYGEPETMTVAVNVRSCHETGPQYKPIANVEVKILNINHIILPIGQTGCFHVKTPFFTKGYLDMTQNEANELKKSCCSDGWFMTDDAAMADDEGNVTIIGKCQDAIRNGSTKVYPSQLEKTLKQIPSVDDAVVIGVPPRATQQEVYACVIVAPGSQDTEDGLLLSCDQMKERGDLECGIKYLRIMDEYPLDKNGQINREELMNTFMENRPDE